jgi:chromosome segregation ATPase
MEQDLVAASAKLDDFKRETQQSTESMERRYRDEIRQLQSGSDETASVWLEKTRSAQQQIDYLSDQLARSDSTQQEAMASIMEKHLDDMDNLKQELEEKDADIETQSHQIEELSNQVESLQNSLEAATVRLEHTTLSNSNSTTTNEESQDAHKECLVRVTLKQKELDEMRGRITEIKEAYESQLNQLGQEKANGMQELRKIIAGHEQRMASAVNEEKLKVIAEKYQQELTTLKDQCQVMVDEKDKALEHYAYRLKALVTSRQQDMEQSKMERVERIQKHEKDVEGYKVLEGKNVGEEVY